VRRASVEGCYAPAIFIGARSKRRCPRPAWYGSTTRGAVRENKLRDPPRVILEDYQWFIANLGNVGRRASAQGSARALTVRKRLYAGRRTEGSASEKQRPQAIVFPIPAEPIPAEPIPAEPIPAERQARQRARGRRFPPLRARKTETAQLPPSGVVPAFIRKSRREGVTMRAMRSFMISIRAPRRCVQVRPFSQQRDRDVQRSAG